MAYSQKAINKWQKNNVKRITLALMLKTDADIIQKLQDVANKTDYVRQLIREDISK